jgi:hypothetical protein
MEYKLGQIISREDLSTGSITFLNVLEVNQCALICGHCHHTDNDFEEIPKKLIDTKDSFINKYTAHATNYYYKYNMVDICL